MERGLIHVYMGNGKGKTTAAVGLAVRAAGHGKRVVFAQFMKGRPSGEITALSSLEGVRILRSDTDFGFYSAMGEAQKQELTRIHNRLLDRIEAIVRAGDCDLLVLDEAVYPYRYRLIDGKRLAALLTQKPPGMEIVVTGREPDKFFLDRADYITEMRCIRHPYEKGIAARPGIEF